MKKIIYTIVGSIWMLMTIWWFGFTITDFNKSSHEYWSWCGFIGFVTIVWLVFSALPIAVICKLEEDE